MVSLATENQALRDGREAELMHGVRLTPFVGLTSPLSIASIMLPFSSATAQDQSISRRSRRNSTDSHNQAITIAHPVSLARRDQQMRGPPLDVSVHVLLLVDAPLAWVPDGTRRAVVQTFLSVNLWIRGREELLGLGRFADAGAGEVGGRLVGRQAGDGFLEEVRRHVLGLQKRSW